MNRYDGPDCVVCGAFLPSQIDYHTRWCWFAWKWLSFRRWLKWGFTKWFSDLWYVYTGRNCGCEQRKVRLIRWLSRRCIARWFRSRWWWFWHVTVNRALRAVWQRWLIGAYYTGRQKPPGGDWQ